MTEITLLEAVDDEMMQVGDIFDRGVTCNGKMIMSENGVLRWYSNGKSGEAVAMCKKHLEMTGKIIRTIDNPITDKNEALKRYTGGNKAVPEWEIGFRDGFEYGFKHGQAKQWINHTELRELASKIVDILQEKGIDSVAVPLINCIEKIKPINSD